MYVRFILRIVRKSARSAPAALSGIPLGSREERIISNSIKTKKKMNFHCVNYKKRPSEDRRPVGGRRSAASSPHGSVDLYPEKKKLLAW